MRAMKLSAWLKERPGRGTALARGIGVPQSFVSKMATGEKQVPLEQCVPIERFTSGAVRCEELRPDKAEDFVYLRECAGIQPPASASTPATAAGVA